MCHLFVCYHSVVKLAALLFGEAGGVQQWRIRCAIGQKSIVGESEAVPMTSSDGLGNVKGRRHAQLSN